MKQHISKTFHCKRTTD